MSQQEFSRLDVYCGFSRVGCGFVTPVCWSAYGGVGCFVCCAGAQQTRWSCRSARRASMTRNVFSPLR